MESSERLVEIPSLLLHRIAMETHYGAEEQLVAFIGQQEALLQDFSFEQGHLGVWMRCNASQARN